MAASNKNIVLYDGGCNLCTNAMQSSKKLDWLDNIEWVNFHDAEATKSIQNLPSKENLTKDMHLVSDNGKISKGFYAWRKILGLMPLTFIPALLLYLPFMPKIGKKIYRKIADNRLGKIRCTDGKCKHSL